MSGFTTKKFNPKKRAFSQLSPQESENLVNNQENINPQIENLSEYIFDTTLTSIDNKYPIVFPKNSLTNMILQSFPAKDPKNKEKILALMKESIGTLQQIEAELLQTKNALEMKNGTLETVKAKLTNQKNLTKQLELLIRLAEIETEREPVPEPN